MFFGNNSSRLSHIKHPRKGRREDGITLPWSDLVIGRLGLLWDLRVFAADRHFDILESRVRLRRYRPGPAGAYSDA